MKYRTKVKSVEQMDRVVRGRMIGGQAVLDKENLGWYVGFEGSWERLYYGISKPDLKVGQLVEITIEGL